MMIQNQDCATRSNTAISSIRHATLRGFLTGACALALLALIPTVAVPAHAADAPVSSPTTPPRATTNKASTHKHSASKAGGSGRLEAICSSADLNHDGSVSLDEFHQDIVQSWHSLSPDATGYVQLQDLAQVPGIGKGRLRRLASADKDGDGKLSFKEVVESRMAYFDAADTDHNDLLSINECVSYERQRRQSAK